MVDPFGVVSAADVVYRVGKTLRSYSRDMYHAHEDVEKLARIVRSYSRLLIEFDKSIVEMRAAGLWKKSCIGFTNEMVDMTYEALDEFDIFFEDIDQLCGFKERPHSTVRWIRARLVWGVRKSKIPPLKGTMTLLICNLHAWTTMVLMTNALKKINEKLETGLAKDNEIRELKSDLSRYKSLLKSQMQTIRGMADEMAQHNLAIPPETFLKVCDAIRDVQVDVHEEERSTMRNVQTYQTESTPSFVNIGEPGPGMHGSIPPSERSGSQSNDAHDQNAARNTDSSGSSTSRSPVRETRRTTFWDMVPMGLSLKGGSSSSGSQSHHHQAPGARFIRRYRASDGLHETRIRGSNGESRQWMD